MTAQDLLSLCLARGDATRFQNLKNSLRSALRPAFMLSPGFRRGLPFLEGRITLGSQGCDHRIVSRLSIEQSRHWQR